MPAAKIAKICKLAENPDFQTALDEFLAKANDINMEVTGVLGSYSRKYKFAAIFHPEKPKNGALKGEMLADEGNHDRALLHAELWLNRNPEKNVLCTIAIHCFSYKIVAFWKE